MDLVADYIKKASVIPLLTAKEEYIVANLIKNGNEIEKRQAKEKMINSNLRLVIKIASSYKNASMPFIDLVQEGNVGLIKAVDKFEPKKGFRFSTYATWWIKQAIGRALFVKADMIRMPVHVYEMHYKIKTFISDYNSKHGEDPSPNQVAKHLSISLKKYLDLLSFKPEVISLDSLVKINTEESDFTLLEAIKDKSFDEEIDTLLIRNEIKKILNTLDERERYVIIHRYGLFNNAQRTLEEIAKKINVTRERVRQIQNIALSKIKSLDEISHLKN